MIARLFAWAIGILLLGSLQGSEALSLRVLVTGANANQGQILLSVFDSEENYLKTPFIDKVKKVDEEGSCVFELTDLKKGEYSVSAVYDEDGNGELNTGLLGIPKELVGFSNNAKGRFGPPSFEKTSFQLETTIEIEINLVNAKG